jgi:hypothetical protein
VSKPAGNGYFHHLIGPVLALVAIAVLVSCQQQGIPQDVAEPTGAARQTMASTLAPDAESVQGESPTPEHTSDLPGTSASYAGLGRLFDIERAMEHIEVLTSEEMDGRLSGTSGGRAAGDYIAARFAEYGLQPAGTDGSYFQSLSVPYGRIIEPVRLKVISPEGDVLADEYEYRTDYRAVVLWYAAGGEAEGQVVWLSECRREDYEGQDVVGKIVLCRRDERNIEIYRQAMVHGASGLLMLELDDVEGPFELAWVHRELLLVNETIPTIMISRRVAHDLLVGSDYTLDELSLRFEAVPLSTTVQMSVLFEEQEEIEARNVLGLLPGSDPEAGDQVVIVGAHYDHLGSDPDGVILAGANDNASGTAVLLEVARLWHEQGVRPARSVLFAAWGAEELGLLGSRHYVQNPVFPLTQTVTCLNMDMLGVGEELVYDGTGPLTTQLTAAAETHNITTTYMPDSGGGSDHVPFRNAGVDTSVLGWMPDYNLHTPRDRIEAIEPDKLRAAGVMVAHALAAVAHDQLGVQRAVEQMVTSVAAGDRDAFLDGVDPTNAALGLQRAAWFDQIWSRELSSAEVRIARILIGDGEATATVGQRYGWGDEAGGRSSPHDLHFVHRDGRWYLDGFGSDTLAGETLSVELLPDVPGNARRILTTTQETYLAISAELGMEPVVGTRVVYYPSPAVLRAIAFPAAERDIEWVISDGALELVWGERSNVAGLTDLVLTQMGLPVGEANWLREGLALHYLEQEDYLPVVASSDAVTTVIDFPDLRDVSAADARALRAHARSAVEYLRERYGNEGLRALCAAWAETGDAEAAFRQALGVSPDQFEAIWLSERIEPVHAVANAIQATLAARDEAVLARDQTAFLRTITSRDSVLRAEESRWFETLAQHPLASYQTFGAIAEYTLGADEVGVRLTERIVITEGQSSRVTYSARFLREGADWLYAGVDWEELAGDHYVVKYQGRDAAWGERVLALAEEVRAGVSADLGLPLPDNLEIKLYDDAELFRSKVSPLSPSINAWSGPGESISFFLDGEDERVIQAEVAAGLARQVLLEQGLQASWLLEGVAAYEAGRAFSLGNHWQARRLVPEVRMAVRRRSELQVDGLPLTPVEFLEGDSELACAQSWSLVSFVAGRYGLAGLRQLIAQSIVSNDAGHNLSVALGVDAEAFWEEWNRGIDTREPTD